MGLRGVGYWIMLDGSVRQVATSHVAELIRDPAAFGWTRSELEACYARHGERLGLEARAREELVVATVQRGFVRIREHIGREGHSWNLTIKALDEASLALVAGWIRGLAPSWKVRAPATIYVVEAREPVTWAELASVVHSPRPVRP